MTPAPFVMISEGPLGSGIKATHPTGWWGLEQVVGSDTPSPLKKPGCCLVSRGPHHRKGSLDGNGETHGKETTSRVGWVGTGDGRESCRGGICSIQ